MILTVQNKPLELECFRNGRLGRRPFAGQMPIFHRRTFDSANLVHPPILFHNSDLYNV